MSLGGGLPVEKLEEALREVKEQGIIPVVAAGNLIPIPIVNQFVTWPAHYKEALSMAAVSVDQNPWDLSSHGPEIDMSGPGHNMWFAKSAVGVDGKEYFGVMRGDGTSLATAMMAGLVAVWTGFHGEARLQEYGKYRLELFRLLLDRIKAKGLLKEVKCNNRPARCDEITRGFYGRGILNFKALLQEELPTVDELHGYVMEHNGDHPSAPTRDYSKKAFLNAKRNADFLDLSVDRFVNAITNIFSINDIQTGNLLEHYGDELLEHFQKRPTVKSSFLAFINADIETRIENPSLNARDLSDQIFLQKRIKSDSFFSLLKKFSRSGLCRRDMTHRIE